jgi:hypothetical protein
VQALHGDSAQLHRDDCNHAKTDSKTAHHSEALLLINV